MIGAMIALAVTLSAPPTITPGAATATATTTAAAGSTTDKAGVQVQAAPAEAKPEDDPDRVICRTEPVTGSRFTTRTCLTKAQMDERDRQTAEYNRQRDNMNGMATHGGAFSGN